MTLVGEIFSLCRDAVSVFYSPSRLVHRVLVGEGSYPPAEMLSVYSTAPADWSTGHSLGEGFTPLQRCCRCILQPEPTGLHGTRWGRVLPLYKDAVVVFYSPSRLVPNPLEFYRTVINNVVNRWQKSIDVQGSDFDWWKDCFSSLIQQ